MNINNVSIKNLCQMCTYLCILDDVASYRQMMHILRVIKKSNDGIFPYSLLRTNCVHIVQVMIEQQTPGYTGIC